MSKIAGVDVLVYVEVDGQSKVLGGQTEATLNREAEEIDVSCKTDGKYGDYLSGRINWSIECSGFIVEGDEAFDYLEQAFAERQPLKVELQYPSGKKYSGEVTITEFPLEFPQDDGASFSLTLMGKGPLQISTDSGSALEA